jgi:parallel beta-helix repeat protein
VNGAAPHGTTCGPIERPPGKRRSGTTPAPPPKEDHALFVRHRRASLSSPIRAAGLVALAAHAFLGNPAPALAQAVCGGYVAPGETLVLTADLGPCDGMDEVLLVESATVDLAGHTVSCADTDADGILPWGIILVGKKAQLRNGTVVGCHHNVMLEDRGRHTVENVTARGAVLDGFQLHTPRNRLHGSTAVDNGDDGVQISGQKNEVAGSVFEGNVEDGIDILDGSRHRLLDNDASGNGDDGIDVTGNRSKLVGNESTDNADAGIRVGGQQNKVLGNTATGNGGWDLEGTEPCTVNRYSENVYGSASGSCM